MTHLNIQIIFSQDWWTLVNGLSRSVEHATQHVFWHGCTQNVTSELANCVLGINTRCSLEDLDDSFWTAHLEHLTWSNCSIIQTQLHNFSEFREFNFIQDNQWTVDTRNSFVVWKKSWDVLVDFYVTWKFFSLRSHDLCTFSHISQLELLSLLFHDKNVSQIIKNIIKLYQGTKRKSKGRKSWNYWFFLSSEIQPTPIDFWSAEKVMWQKISINFLRKCQ